MESGESWWRKSAGVEETPRTQPEAKPEAPSRGEDTVDFEAEVGDSLGEQIDRAIGEFDNKIMQLKESLQEKRTEVKELEIRISDLEKDQAKAFKQLLGANPQIKRMLGPKTKSRTPSKRKKKTTPKTTTEDVDNESLL